MPWKILAAMATMKYICLSSFMQATAIIKNEDAVKIVTIPALVICLMLTQQAPLTSLELAPNRIMKKRNRDMNYCSSKASAKSLAAAYTRVYPLLLKIPTTKKAKKYDALFVSTLWFKVYLPFKYFYVLASFLISFLYSINLSCDVY